MAGDAFDLWVVKSVNDDFVVRPEQSELCADRASGAALWLVEDPQSEENDDQENPNPEYKTEFPHSARNPLLAGVGLVTNSYSDHSYCFGQNRGNAEEISPVLLQFG